MDRATHAEWRDLIAVNRAIRTLRRLAPRARTGTIGGMMKTQIQITLLVAAALYMAWGLALLLAPGVSHRLISTGPYDPSTTALFAAALLGMMVTFLIAAYDPEKEIVRAAATGLAFVGFTAAYLLFIGKSIPLSVVSVGSLGVDLLACAILFLTEMRLDFKKQSATKPRAGGRRRSGSSRKHA